MVTEQETFCFYDSSIWTPSLTPPAPCSNGQTAVTLTPASLAFPPHPTGTTSAPLQATLTNTGGAALVFTSLGRPGDFYGSWNCPRILQPGASCTITVAITPSAAGTPRGTVLITDNAPGSHQKAAAGGYGVPSGGIEIAGVSGDGPGVWPIRNSGNGWHRDTGDFVGAVQALLAAGAVVPLSAEELEPSKAVLEVLRGRTESHPNF